MACDIPASAVVELGVMREKRRKADPPVGVDYRKQRPPEADVDGGGARPQRLQCRVERRAAVAEDADPLADKPSELNRSIGMSVDRARHGALDHIGDFPGAAAVLASRQHHAAR